jgi:hypothetical protein
LKLQRISSSAAPVKPTQDLLWFLDNAPNRVSVRGDEKKTGGGIGASSRYSTPTPFFMAIDV